MHYKFLNGGDVDRVLVDGTVMISTLKYFRALERGGIGDPLEGAVSVGTTEETVLTEDSPALAAFNAANVGLKGLDQFVKVRGGGTVTIGAGSCIKHVHSEFFIYSFAIGDLSTLTQAMCIEATEPYDACLKINDPSELGRALFHTGTIPKLGRRVDEVFADIAIGPVEYVPRSQEFTVMPALVPSPFKKEERFAAQSEGRLVFIPRDGAAIALDRMVIAVPDPGAHFTIEFGGSQGDRCEVKRIFGHGNFLPWIEAEFGMSQQSASRFMSAADAFGSKLLTVSDLPPSVLYALAAPSTSPEVRERIVERVGAGEKMLRLLGQHWVRQRRLDP